MATTRSVGTRTIGGLTVSTIGLGCMGMTGRSYGGADREEAIATIRRALDLGVTLLDTADAYSLGANEELVAEAISGRRDEVQLATKFGAWRREPGREWDGRPETARISIEGSLQRLDVEVIDLCYLHRVDPQVPIEESVGAMSDLVQQGKVRYLGLSEA